MKARDIMTTAVITATSESPVEHIVKLMLENSISALPIVDNQQRVVGMVSEGDLMNRPEAETHRDRSWWLSMLADTEQQAKEFSKVYGRKAADVMTRNVITVQEDASVADVAEKLEKHRIKRVPVVRDGKLVGIVSRANLLHCVGQLYRGRIPDGESGELRDAILARLSEAGIRPNAINVMLLKDAVELWGAVANPEQIAAAEVAVASVVGERMIENHLSVLDPRAMASYGGA